MNQLPIPFQSLCTQITHLKLCNRTQVAFRLATDIDSAFVRKLHPTKHLSNSIANVVGAAILGVLVFAPGATAGVVVPESGGSPNADSIATLYKFLFALGAIVFVGVEGLLFWFLFKYRARKGSVAAQVRGNSQLEIGWTVGAAALLVIISAVTFIKLSEITTPAGSSIDANGNPVSSASSAGLEPPKVPKGASIKITVSGQQFIWRYQYPGPEKVYSYEEMVVPVGMTVILDINSNDVAHSWWIPKLGGKFDAVPGYVNHTWFKITDPDTYVGQCAELCGANHANMTARVRAVPFTEYRAWYRKQALEIKQAERLAAEQRNQITASQGKTARRQRTQSLTPENGTAPDPQEGPTATGQNQASDPENSATPGRTNSLPSSTT